MDEEKFQWINDDEIEQLLGKQEEEAEESNEIEDILKETMENDENQMDDGMLEELLSYKKPKNEYEVLMENDEREEVSISPMFFREFVEEDVFEIDPAGLDLLFDIPMELSVSLGEVRMEIAKLSRLQVGTIIPLKKLAGEPVEIFIGDILIAKGETYVIDNENTFGVMITEIVSEKERILSVYETLKKQKQN